MTILFAGQEDISFQLIGIANGGIVYCANQSNTVTGGLSAAYLNMSVNRFRAGYARYGLDNRNNIALNTTWWRATFTATTQIWATARAFVWYSGGQTSAGSYPIVFRTSDGVIRLRLRVTTENFSMPTAFVWEKVNSAGTATQLGSSMGTLFSNSPSTPQKVDIFINYATSGTLTMYFDGVQMFSYSGDVTTDSQTQLAMLDLGQALYGQTGSENVWSEVIVATTDTRNYSLITQNPIATGNADQWTSASGPSNTFANSTSISGTDAHSANDVWFSKMVVPDTGQVTQLGAYLNNNLTATAQLALYSDASGVPGTLLGSTSNITNPIAGMNIASMTAPPWVAAGTTVWIAIRVTVGYTTNRPNPMPMWNVGALQTGQSVFPSTAGAALQTASSVGYVQMTIQNLAVGAAAVQTALADTSGTANQIQEYQVTPALPTGTYSILAVVHHLMATQGSSGPTHLNDMVRLGSTDYTVSLSPGTAWGLLQNIWTTNPATSAAWATSDLVAASASFNLGYQSLT